MSKYVQLKDPVTGEAVYPIIARDPNIASFSEVAGSDTVNPMGIEYGGTGATTAEQARINLGINPTPTYGTIAFGHYNATTTGSLTDSRTHHQASQFSGHSYSHAIRGDDVFATDPNGFKVLKSGFYLLMLHSHYNTSASNIQMATQFFNYTKSSNVASIMFNVNPSNWGMLANHGIAHLDAGDIIIPQWQKYTEDTTTQWRPSSIQYDIVLLNED